MEIYVGWVSSGFWSETYISTQKAVEVKLDFFHTEF